MCSCIRQFQIQFSVHYRHTFTLSSIAVFALSTTKLSFCLLKKPNVISAKTVNRMSRFVSRISLGVRTFLPGRISLAMSTHAPETTMPAADKDPKNVIKSRYKDVLVKAGDDIYYLDRLKLALNSGYFEKLLLSPEWNDQNAEPINVPLDSNTFSSVVDVIYNSDPDWSAVLNVNNFVSVLKAKDFLEIRECHYGFSDFISHYLEKAPTSDVKVFELYKFIVDNGTLDRSLGEIFAYLAKNLKHFHDHVEFLSLPIDHFVEIITYNEPYFDFYSGCRDKDAFQQDPNLVPGVCCKWICYDLENRLPLIVKVSNAALKGLGCMRTGNDEGIKMNLSDIDEQAKHEVVRRYFKRLMKYGTVLDPDVADKNSRGKFNEHFHSSFDQKYFEKDKLEKYLKNGDLYDITVKVQGKSYKLHRSILELKSGYFAELFSTEYGEAAAQCDGIPSLPSKDKEYVIEGIDEATFDFVVNHIYFGKRLSDDECTRIFKAAYILKIGTLLDECKSCITNNIDKFDSKGSKLDMLDLIQGKDEFKDLYTIFLKRHVTNSWPNIGHKAGFYSIPWDLLENWLASSDFYFDDAEKLLNLCSAWIMHDVKIRYPLIPQVALAIKRYGLPDYEDYKMETPTDLSSISEKSIRDKLWEISSSLSLIPTSTEACSGELSKFQDCPVFVTSDLDGVLDVLNIDFDQIGTMRFRKPHHKQVIGPCRSISATIIEDNLFIMVKIEGNGFILAYNVPSKKFIELNTDFRIKERDVLLNRRNELYCGSSKDGSLLKYSFELNRWMRFSKPDSNVDSDHTDGISQWDKENMVNVYFTSDGDKIYRLYQVPGTETNPTSGYNMEWFDFKQNQWISSSNCSFEDMSNHIVDFTIINDSNPAILLTNVVLWYDLNSSKWSHFKLPDNQYWFNDCNYFSVITQEEDGIVQVFNRHLYHYSNSKKIWEFKKEMTKRNTLFRNAPYYNIVAVNRPRVLI